MKTSSTRSVATTRGVRVTVQSRYLESQSSPAGKRYVFAYAVRIENVDGPTVQLRSRHWIITDAEGKVEQVRGPGVVGHQPTLRRGESFEYSSGAVLKTPWGSMEGSYQMFLEDGSSFDAEISVFALEQPYALN